jgi:hypothetical protein
MIAPSPGQGVVSVYCEMTREGGGWVRIADLDATRDACPGDWQPLADPVAVCTRNLTAGGARSATFTAPYAYTEVMGYVRGYAFGSPDSFDPGPGVDGIYVDGVSITRSPAASAGGRLHLYTYVAAWSDDNNAEGSLCPCLGGKAAPDFVGTDFYCEAGTTGSPLDITPSRWYVDDPLWNGDGTGSDCNTAGDPSWFVAKPGGTPSTDPVEVRVMADQDSGNEDIGVSEMELFVR